MTTLTWRMVVNLPGIMAHQMQEVATSKLLCLPYGMELTRVFHAFNISLEGKAFKELLHTDMYDDWSLHRMGYQKMGERWIRSIIEQEAELDSKDEIGAIEAGPSEPTGDGTCEVELIDDNAAEVRTPAQPTPRSPRAPPLRAQIDDDISKRISSIISMVRQDIHNFYQS